MSSAEFVRWMAYFKKEPFGYPAELWRMGVVASTVANVAPRKKGAKPLKPSDFYPDSKRAKDLTPRQEKQLREKRVRKRAK